MLKKRGIKHVVLNAKYHAQEAEIVAQAGGRGTVTIATNMAGRGTDILLGGNPEHMARQQAIAEEVAEKLAKGEEKFVDDDEFVYFFHIDAFYRVPRADWDRIFGHFRAQCAADHDEVVRVGGLHILGTERHEARRIDNQLRGRAGRQGDPGSSRFYLSLEDDLMRIFGSDRISGLMEKLGMEEGVPIEHGMVTKAIERAQKQVEAQNFSVRKHLLEYDDVMNKQRESVYTLRREILEGQIHLNPEEMTDTRGYVMATAEEILDARLALHCPDEADVEEWDFDGLKRDISQTFALDDEDYAAIEIDQLGADVLQDTLLARITSKYEEKERIVPAEAMRRLERDVMLHVVDSQWKDHLYSLDHLKEGIGLRGYGQRDPLVEYKKESYTLFQDMKTRIDEEVVRYLWWLRPVIHGEGEQVAVPAAPAPRRQAALSYSAPSGQPAPAFGAGGAAERQARKPARVGGDDAPVKTVKREEPKIGRNDPCWCGSGKKFKKCHGA